MGTSGEAPGEGQRGHVPPAFAPGRRPRVAAVCPRGDPGAARWLEGARAAARDLGLTLAERTVAAGAPAAGVLAEEAGASAALVVRGLHGPEVLAVLAEAVARGVRVVGAAGELELPGAPVVEEDHLLAGHLAVRAAFVDGGPRERVLVVGGLGTPVEAARAQALAAFRRCHPGLAVVAQLAVGPARAAAEVARALAEAPDTGAVLVLSEALLAGAAAAARGAPSRPRVYVTGLSPAVLRELLAGDAPVAAAAGADPAALGGVAVRAAAALLAGERVPAVLPLEPALVTRAWLLGNSVRGMDELVEAVPSLDASAVVWFPWMDALRAREGRAAPSAGDAGHLAARLRLTLAALELRNTELQRAAQEVRAARDDLERRVEERTAELSVANARLAASRAYLGRIIDAAASPISVSDSQGRFVLVNDAWCALLGLPREGVLGRRAEELLPPPEASVHRAHDEEVQARGGELVSEERLTDARGAAHVVVARRSIYRNDAGAPFVVSVLDDLTARKELELQLRQSQKMESLGLLAGGVAHDFNNLLTPILGYSEVLVESAPPDHPDRDMMVAIHDSATRARDLTRRLLAFSRKGPIEQRVLDLGELVRGFAGMLRRTLRENIRIELDVPQDAPAVRADPALLELVLLNLSVNAQDAMAEGGVLRIELGVCDAAGLDPALRPEAAQGRCARLAVRDTGVGIPPDVLPRVFEPFFTTKEAGRGTGLGLSTVYGIVKQHGGAVAVASERGRGACFTLVLPAAAAEVGQASPRPAVAVAAPSPAGGTVLVVEDDERVRALTERLLQASGFQVLSAGDGEAGLAILREHVGPIDLLLTDVVMPRMDGRALQAAALRCRPGIRTVFMSGYALDVLASHGVANEGAAFLQKPFSPTKLLERVTSALRSP